MKDLSIFIALNSYYFQTIISRTYYAKFVNWISVSLLSQWAVSQDNEFLLKVFHVSRHGVCFR